MRTTAAGASALAKGDIENFLVASTPGGIEAQEAQGQRDLCAASRLPKESDRAQLEAAGVIFGADHDDLFVNVTLPPGWAVKPTEHSMWNDLVDDKGRKRAGIFYKAAFYDRSARLTMNRRYTVNGYRECDADGVDVSSRREGSPTYCRVVVEDADGSVLFAAGVYPYSDHRASGPLEKAAQEWLAKEFPDHKDPTAYW